jgi:uncharacterized small protein (DUF1192 family)
MCDVCGTAHWLRDPHVFAAAGPERNVTPAPRNVTRLMPDAHVVVIARLREEIAALTAELDGLKAKNRARQKAYRSKKSK